MPRHPSLRLILIGIGLIGCSSWSLADESVLADPEFFPIAVWLQSPSKAPQYKAAGINLYVGLWRGQHGNAFQLMIE